MSTSEDTIRTSLSAVLEPLGLLIEDVTVIPAGKRRLVRILVDRVIDLEAGTTQVDPVAPVSLDEVAEATRVVSDELDASDAMGSAPYTLEVSSPGTDRPLVQPRHFARNVGRLVTLTRDDGTKVSGRIVSANATSVDVMPEQGGKKAGAAAGDPVTTNYESITRAVVQVEFARGADADAEGEDQ